MTAPMSMTPVMDTGSFPVHKPKLLPGRLVQTITRPLSSASTSGELVELSQSMSLSRWLTEEVAPAQRWLFSTNAKDRTCPHHSTRASVDPRPILALPGSATASLSPSTGQEADRALQAPQSLRPNDYPDLSLVLCGLV